MWPVLDRTKRRLLRGAAARGPALEAPAHVDDPAAGIEPAGPPVDDVVLAIGKADLDRLGVALQAYLGPGITRPDTPARLEIALAAALERLGASCHPAVTRRPAGLYTPEAWQLRLTACDPDAGDVIRRAIREGVFAA